VQRILKTVQDVLYADGPRREINVNADAATLQVRKIIRNMVADETAGRISAGRIRRRPRSEHSLSSGGRSVLRYW
jgi:hypothetical protein